MVAVILVLLLSVIAILAGKANIALILLLPAEIIAQIMVAVIVMVAVLVI
jgi:hypothetical protein